MGENLRRLFKILSKKGDQQRDVDEVSSDVHLACDVQELMKAAEEGKLKLVRKLLRRRANPNSRDFSGMTSLAKASFGGHLNVVKHLLAQHADINTAADNGDTPLHWAAIAGRLDVVKDHGARTTLQNETGNTPLHEAAFYGQKHVVIELLSRGANVNAANHSKIMKILLNAQAKMHQKMKNGQTAHDIGNEAAKTLLNEYQRKRAHDRLEKSKNDLSMNIQSATEIILHAVQDGKESTVDIFTIASSVFTLSMKAQLHRQKVFTTALMVERIVRHLKVSGALHNAQEAFLVLKDIEMYWKKTLLTIQPWKWKLDDTHHQDKINKIGVAIIDLQERLLQAAKHF
ncbi:hypothetical protein Ae201684_017438 [Aphanomyces euteiches]|uniref:Uncharacterized protein n=1 Tax=Aphanomyces euteiches TaxID=100861 RepID=A0A6G0WA72_9STRA|nr:hypothetical protein Ae201684_017438 [Aphanomyces euteiches]KAH9148621.1 hypothetical protein AeRB84_008071 [Aphanomyces euteiches]